MATGTAQPNQPAASSTEADRFIAQQLEKTRFQVRFVDLASSLMALVAAILVYTLVLTVVDHWIMPLARWGRWLAGTGLLAAVGYYLASVVVPLMVRPINPVYAARAIEEADPTLKNSLINFLLFRNDHTSLHRVVFSAMEQRAAADLHRVPIEHAVDRSKVIHFGYLLAGVLGVCAAYTILSPKDPLPSVARVLAPWTDIERPTRVQIDNVQPGDAVVFQGDTVEVSCSLVGKAESVTLYFSTVDGEIDEQAVEMQSAADGRRYECALPPEPSGFQQAVTYRIEAGDAISPMYRIEVSPAPHITVQQLEYEFPAYTRRPKQTEKGQADIKALEGTRVTIRATANRPIRSAYVQLNELSGKTSQLPMEFRDREAWRTITLELQADRRTPLHNTYQLGFVTDAGRESSDPISHRIEVLPDLPPEVSILTPRQEVTEVPQDGSQKIEVRAIDPDFGIVTVRLHFVMGGTALLDKVLLNNPQGVEGQTIHSYEFRPHLLGLQPGDRVVYRGSAEDNRVAVASNSPEPNQARTKDYQLLVVPPVNATGKAGGEAAPEPGPKNQTKDKSPDGPGTGETAGREQPDPGGAESSEETEGGGDETQEGVSGAAQQGGVPQEGEQGSGKAESQPQAGQDGADGGQPQGSQSGGGEQSGGNTEQQDGEAGGEPSSGNPQGPSEPLHDGEVFEKALQHMKQQAQDAGQRGKGQSTEGDSDNNSQEPQEGSKTSGGNEGANQGASQGESADGSAGQKQSNGDQRDRSQQPADPDSPGKGAQHDDNNLGAGAQKRGATGEGGSSEKPDQATGKNGAEPNDGDEREPAGPKDMREKDAGSGDSGDSGAGQNSQDTSGSGSVDAAQEPGKPEERIENRDRQKELQPDTSQPQEDDAPGSTRDKKQSDSQGDSSGDRSGGGKKGPGQGANQAGNDSAGQNNAADEGAGAASESGNGETSSAAGDKQRSEGETGSAGHERGDGSSSRGNPSGDNAGGGKQPPAGGGQDKSAPDDSPAGSTGGPKQGRDGMATGGGLPSDNEPTSAIDKALDVPPGDEANLEYTRRATDMVLEFLKDQQDNPDRELLDELGWTEKELGDFLKRWQQLKQGVAEGDSGQRELDESLRSLGMRPVRDRIRQGTEQSDGVTGLRDAGPRTTPPPAYQKLFDAFKKGAARSTR